MPTKLPIESPTLLELVNMIKTADKATYNIRQTMCYQSRVCQVPFVGHSANVVECHYDPRQKMEVCLACGTRQTSILLCVLCLPSVLPWALGKVGVWRVPNKMHLINPRVLSIQGDSGSASSLF